MMVGINKTIEYFSHELQRKKHSERNIWHPDFELQSNTDTSLDLGSNIFNQKSADAEDNHES